MTLSAPKRDLVVRLIQAGVESSTDRLGRLSRTDWGVNFSGTRELSPVRVLSWFALSRQHHVSVRFRSTTSVPLEFLILFSEESARSVAKAVAEPYLEELGALADLVRPTIAEVCNILAQNVLAVLSDRCGVAVILTVPEVGEGAKADLTAEALEGYDGRKDLLLLAQVQLHSERLQADCSMMVIVNEAVMEGLLARIPAAG